MNQKMGLGTVALLVCIVAAIFATNGGNIVVAICIWIISAFIFMASNFGALNLWNPVVIVWWVGLVPAVLPLLFYQEFNVGIESQTQLVVPIYLACFSSFLFIVHFVAPRGYSAPSPSPNAGYRSPRLLTFLGSILLTASLGASAWMIRGTGNVYSAINPEAARAETVDGAGIMGTVAFVGLAIGAPAILAPSFMQKKQSLPQLVPRVLLVLAAMIGIGMGGTRIHLIRTFIIVVIVISILKWGRVPRRILAFAGVISLLMLGVVGQARYVGQQATALEIIGDRFSSNPHVAGLILDFADTSGFWNGRALFAPFDIYAPGSNPALGEILKHEMGLVFAGGGVATPLPAEGYMDFGWIGVVGYGFVGGLLVSIVARLSKRAIQAMGIITPVVLGVTIAGIFSGLGTTLAMFFIPILAGILGINFLMSLSVTRVDETRLNKSFT